jgi:hypothetical protein
MPTIRPTSAKKLPAQKKFDKGRKKVSEIL